MTYEKFEELKTKVFKELSGKNAVEALDILVNILSKQNLTEEEDMYTDVIFRVLESMLRDEFIRRKLIYYIFEDIEWEEFGEPDD